jgi:hypothetical protein
VAPLEARPPRPQAASRRAIRKSCALGDVFANSASRTRSDECAPSGTSSARTALVTGATGFLGLNLVRELTDAGWEVDCAPPPGRS